MTDLTYRPEEVDDGQLKKANDRVRVLTTTVIVLAVALLGLGAWAVYDQTTAPETVTEEIQTLIDDYLGAFNNYDGEALLKLVTADYAQDMASHPISLVQHEAAAHAMMKDMKSRDWQSAVIGEPITIGNDPWFASVAERHTATSGYGPGGANGISTFTIVDDGGSLKVARHTYVGNN